MFHFPAAATPKWLICSLAMAAVAVLLVPPNSWAQEADTKSEVAAPEEATGEEVSQEVATDEAAGEEPAPALALLDDMNTLWTCLAAFLVFFMQAGFALVETGFTRAKNACNIMMKNLMDFSIGSLAFWAIGFGLMFGLNASGWIGTDGFLYEGKTSFDWAFLIFQTVFCATAATIVSGAMAERTKFQSYLVYSLFITAFIYPIFGSWCWNGLMLRDEKGWLEGSWGFYDFAGSTVVHSVGGWCALAGAIVLGPRIGKYVKGKVMPIPGHSIPLAALGVFILWLGWFGFNPGSTTAVGEGKFAYIAVTTNLAAAAGAVGGLFMSWAMFKKPDPSFALNGTLAGLVAITAGCNAMTVPFAILTGLVGGVVVVPAVVLLDKMRVDDPVGAVSVHGVCGAWGTAAVGLFMSPELGPNPGLVYGGTTQLIGQLVGIAAGFVWAFGASMVLFTLLKVTIGLRVSAEEEIEGLDLHEHGMLAYPPGFVADTPTGSPIHPGPVMGSQQAAGAPSPAAS